MSKAFHNNKKQLEAAVIDLNGMYMFLGHDWLVKYNSEVNWKNSTIRFTRCPGSCIMKLGSKPEGQRL